jgi:hypothetical protein
MDAGPTYTLARGEQRYGPYTLDQLRDYFAAGSIQPTDLVWTPGMATWSPVSDVLDQNAAQDTPPPIPAADPTPAKPAPKPPALHWAIVLVLALVTWGLFAGIWMFVHAVWVKRIDPKSKALYVLAGGLAFALFVGIISGITGGGDAGPALLVRLAWIAAVLVAYFDMRAAVEVRFGVELSGILTFFFSVFYLQYHLRLIAKGQHTPRSGRIVT